MADFTPNYNLKKPLRTEYYSVADMNGNSDKIDVALNSKVDKEAGKGLSDENYTLEEKNKLSGIEENATGDMTALEVKQAYESNVDTNAYTDAEKSKVANVPDNTIAQLNDMTQDFNAQLAEKVQNFKLKNEVINGDFSQGLGTWDNKIGATLTIDGAVLKIIGNGSNVNPRLVNYNYGLNLNNKLYYSIMVKYLKKPTTGSYIYLINSLTFVIAAHVVSNFPTLNQWGRYSAVINPIGSTGELRNYINLHFDTVENATDAEFHVTKPIIVDLTAIFGAGNEPTKLEMDELIKVIPNGWWDGELSLTQKQFITWQLNIIRKNTNAIIALGGTII